MYILWINYGIEGWSPNEYSSIDKLKEDILKGVNNGMPFRVTKELKVNIEIKEIEEEQY